MKARVTWRVGIRVLPGGSIGLPSPLAAKASPVPGATTSTRAAVSAAGGLRALDEKLQAREVLQAVSQGLGEHFGRASGHPERSIDHQR